MVRAVDKADAFQRSIISEAIYHFKTVATVDNLCMADHVKFVMHFKDFMACCNMIIGGLMDGSLCRIFGPGPAGPRTDIHPTSYVTTEHRHVSQDSLFSATALLSTSECPLSSG